MNSEQLKRVNEYIATRKVIKEILCLLEQGDYSVALVRKGETQVSSWIDKDLVVMALDGYDIDLRNELKRLGYEG